MSAKIPIYNYLAASYTVSASTCLTVLSNIVLKSFGSSATTYSTSYLPAHLENWSREGLVNVIRAIVVSIAGKDVVRNVVTYIDPDYGPVIRFVIDLSVRDALELWLKLVELFPYERYGIVVGIRWTKENNVSETELIGYLVKIMLVSGLRPAAKKILDIVEELREERDKR